MSNWAGKFALLSGPPDDFRGSAGIFLFGICLAFKRDFIYMSAGLSVPAVLLADIDDCLYAGLHDIYKS